MTQRALYMWMNYILSKPEYYISVKRRTTDLLLQILNGSTLLKSTGKTISIAYINKQQTNV